MKRNLDRIFKYSLIKVSLMPISIWIISSLVFLLLRIAPGGPCDAMLGIGADQLARDKCRIENGLDSPLIDQYLNRSILELSMGFAPFKSWKFNE